MKKLLGILMVLVLAIGSLTGCTQVEAATSASSTPAPSASSGASDLLAGVLRGVGLINVGEAQRAAELLAAAYQMGKAV